MQASHRSASNSSGQVAGSQQKQQAAVHVPAGGLTKQPARVIARVALKHGGEGGGGEQADDLAVHQAQLQGREGGWRPGTVGSTGRLSRGECVMGVALY